MQQPEIKVINVKAAGVPFKMGTARGLKVIYPEMGAQHVTLNYAEHEPGWEFRQHVHESSEDVIVCLAGSGVIRSGDIRIPFQAGDVVYVPAGVVHGTINTGSEVLVMFSCQAPPDPGLYTGEKDRDSG